MADAHGVGQTQLSEVLRVGSVGKRSQLCVGGRKKQNISRALTKVNRFAFLLYLAGLCGEEVH